uniref:uncharacterized protein LOC122598671 n=1 Tax=Erigeron canadensis TaxID=72917 RepID=UPI001CB9C80A|nr:uncharacterized protein LOC122598671 [Erigeron canadensis]
MDIGHKHFTHGHNLTLNQAHEAAKMSCSGCNSLVIGTMYICWQCNFVLHEQCFRATRSLKHPSHPSHPLTLFPYPTYPSNSFYCNSCKLSGTGLSYSCSDCEFDLHVYCAQSSSNNTNTNNPATLTQVNNYYHGQEAMSQSQQYSYVTQNVYPPSAQNHNPITNPQHSSMNSNMQEEEISLAREKERIRMDAQRHEIVLERYRLEAKIRQDCIDLI